MRSTIRCSLFSLVFTFSVTRQAIGQTPSGGNAAHGRQVFQQNCAVCHASGLDPQVTAGQGPLLAGVVGRTAASLSNFSYTPALKNSGLKWDRATLDRFLASPTTMVPGTNMVLAVPNAADRSDLIAFLATLRPVALPTPTEAAAAARHPKNSGDWQNDAPGVVHHVRVEDLPAPYATRSAGNSPRTVDQPANAKLSVPPGFQVKLYAADLSGPRLMRTAPNGDIFIAETRAGRIRVLRAPDGADTPTENAVFANGLRGPFGIAFYPRENPQWIYVGNRNSVVRFPYRTGDLRARGRAETVMAELSETTGGHTTRDVAFSLDGKRMFVSVGSGSNVAEGTPRKSPAEIRAWESDRGVGAAWDDEANRADVLVADPEGRGVRIFATGIRNAVGLAVQPTSGKLWVAVNERDNLGDDLVPDYISHLEEGGFYGWPWYYLGNHEDPRWRGARPDLAGKAIVPDVLVQAHSAALELTFYPTDVTGPSAFPAEYRGQIFAALHGSWNRTGRTGSKIIRVRLKDGAAIGDYEDFVTGFVLNDSEVWGRPVGVTTAHDGALLFSDDANGTIWRVSYRH
jgi:glucose/arabinose dehydrogenase/mono/diheme cytochrome c family protein